MGALVPPSLNKKIVSLGDLSSETENRFIFRAIFFGGGGGLPLLKNPAKILPSLEKALRTPKSRRLGSVENSPLLFYLILFFRFPSLFPALSCF